MRVMLYLYAHRAMFTLLNLYMFVDTELSVSVCIHKCGEVEYIVEYGSFKRANSKEAMGQTLSHADPLQLETIMLYRFYRAHILKLYSITQLQITIQYESYIKRRHQTIAPFCIRTIKKNYTGSISVLLRLDMSH